MALEVLNQPLSTNQQVNQWIDEIRSKTAKSKGQVIQLLRMALTGQKVRQAGREEVTEIGGTSVCRSGNVVGTWNLPGTTGKNY